MTTGDTIFRCSALVLVSAMLTGCQTASQPRPTYTASTFTPYSPPAPAGACKNVNFVKCKAEDVEDCERRATNGDTDAMVQLGNLYKTDFTGCTKYRDGQKAADILRKASDQGNQEALRQLRQLYSFGQAVPKNARLASSYLKEGTEKGYDWAIAANIYEKDKAGDPTAVNDLRTSAISGNCHSQISLAQFYRTGIIATANSPALLISSEKKPYPVAQNMTKAYFWSLVSVSSAATIPKKKYWDIFGISEATCPIEHAPSWYDVEKQLGWP